MPEDRTTRNGFVTRWKFGIVGKVAVFSLNLDVEESAAGDTPEVVTNANKVAEMEATHRAEHNPRQGVAEERGCGQRDRSAGKDSNQAKQLTLLRFTQRQGEYDERDRNDRQSQKDDVNCGRMNYLPSPRRRRASARMAAASFGVNPSSPRSAL